VNRSQGARPVTRVRRAGPWLRRELAARGPDAKDRVSLSRWDNRRLLERVRQGDQLARETLVLGNMGLVRRLAAQLARPGSGLDFEDLVQEGVVGLLTAIDRFDLRRDTAFSTYAVWWIREAMTEALAERGRVIRVPRYLQPWLRRDRDDSRGDELPPVDEPSAETLERARAAWLPPMSLSEPFPFDPGAPRTWEEVVADSIADPLEELVFREGIEEIRQGLAMMPPEERRLLQARYGWAGPPLSLRALARQYGVSPEWMRRLVMQAEARLRQLLGESRGFQAGNGPTGAQRGR
jgi:RNA polymerase primary sigma factor